MARVIGSREQGRDFVIVAIHFTWNCQPVHKSGIADLHDVYTRACHELRDEFIGGPYVDFKGAFFTLAVKGGSLKRISTMTHIPLLGWFP